MAGELLILQEFCTQKNRTVKKPSGYRISISKKPFMLSPFSLNGFQYQFLIYVPSIACVFPVTLKLLLKYSYRLIKTILKKNLLL